MQKSLGTAKSENNLKKNSRKRKILIKIAQVLIFFVLPLIVSILDHFFI